MKPRGGQGNCERSFSLVLEASSQIPKGPPLGLRDSVDFRSPGLLAAPLLGIAILLRITALLRVAALRITALLRVAALLRITALLLEAWIDLDSLPEGRQAVDRRGRTVHCPSRGLPRNWFELGAFRPKPQ